ncbi:hypothetical protein GCM10028806_33250 [Spirosoma terrae]|uniref:Uncharacterized protein n=1 Tax=Spirosoma terrae TaxID=1968276 RepID=A0A6L9L5H6_9BACT|nr:hypothetical protein [Spirosoma terrae]NDU95640.1 hypothetical protein [Spirosoma terrae]
MFHIPYAGDYQKVKNQFGGFAFFHSKLCLVKPVRGTYKGVIQAWMDQRQIPYEWRPLVPKSTNSRTLRQRASRLFIRFTHV